MAESLNERPPQHQEHQPGVRKAMTPEPWDSARGYKPAGKLKGKSALITGGDSGIGRSTAVAFAKEGARVAIAYFDETEDAQETRRLVENEGVECRTFAGDIGSEAFCRSLIQGVVDAFGTLDVLVNNAAEQHPQYRIEDISSEQLERTFRTNFFGPFFLTQAALPHLRDGSAIINTSSITAFRGSPHLIDYAATKGALVAFTRSLAKALSDRHIRVNAVAPGPVWTPLIPASFDAEEVKSFGSDNPMGRAAEADEISPCFVFLASDDSAFMTGEVLHPNGGEYLG